MQGSDAADLVGDIAAASRRGFLIDLADCEIAQEFVGFPLFLPRLAQQLRRIIHPEFLGPGRQRAVSRHLVVLDRLRGGEQAGIEGRGAFVFVHDLLAFVENAHDGIASLAAGRLAEQFKYLLEALDAGLLAAAQAVEHYEISRYGTLKQWALQLGMKDASRLLDQTLQQEKKTDASLTSLAEAAVNLAAAA